MVDDRVALKQQIKSANDIVDVVGEYLTLRPAGPTFKGLCPFHEDRNPSLDVDPRRQRYRCWACNKYGDVFNFVQEIKHISFPEALELLAHRVGISLENTTFAKQGPSRARMLDVTSWAAGVFHQYLLDAPEADVARKYLGERGLSGETVRRFGLGFAPGEWGWLVSQAANAGKPLDVLEQVGLIARNNEGSGYYDRFRDRVLFPIRDVRGQTVGFGGRILPSSPLSARAPKYYNSAETFLFSKSEQLYGIDRARDAASKAGYLAVVEGYTDVLMAHQMGICQVVATMGTALNERHVKKLRGLVPRVVLVFDADAGGNTGVDRALEVFIARDVDLRVASLPEGLDPCDLLVQQGPDPFRAALENAVDVFEFKLERVWQDAQGGVDSKSRAVEQMLQVLAGVPELRSVKLELMVNRIAHRLNLKEETVWSRLVTLHADRHRPSAAPAAQPVSEEPRQAPAPRHEVELLEVLLAEPALVACAAQQIRPAHLQHPGLRLLLEALYRLEVEGLPADLDHLQLRLDNEQLLAKALNLQLRGLDHKNREQALHGVMARFRELEYQKVIRQLQNQLQATSDPAAAMELLRKLSEIRKLSE